MTLKLLRERMPSGDSPLLSRAGMWLAYLSEYGVAQREPSKRCIGLAVDVLGDKPLQ
jgi:hypothetical protein